MAAAKWNYEEYNRPRLVTILKALRLDVEYTRGQGDYLYYENEAGESIGVLDIAGGMGSTFLGHNHPEIKKTIISSLERDVPMHAQGSVRETAGRLSKRLSELYPGDEKRYVILTNTGTEAVETALKHAEFNRMMRLKAIYGELRAHCKKMKIYFERHAGYSLPEEYEDRGYEALITDVALQAQILEKLPPVVVSTMGAFHGKTTSALKVTGNKMYREAFERMSGIDARFIAFNDSAALGATLDECYFTLNKIVVEDGKVKIVEEKHLNLTAFILEPIQGEGGIHVATDDYIRDIVKLRERHGFEWILDEIQTGMGRTGKLFAIEHYDVDADAVDYVLTSKALGAGTNKISATLVRDSIHDRDFGVIHTSTFGEDAPSCEVALKALEITTRNDNELINAAAQKGALIIGKLKEIQKDFPEVVKDVRGRGLIACVEFSFPENSDSIFFSQIAEQGGLAMLATGYLFHEFRIRTSPPLNSVISHKPVNVMRIEPSAYISEEDIDKLVDGFRRTAEIISKANAYELSRFIIGKETPGEYHDVEDFFEASEPKPVDPEFEDCPRMGFQFHPLDVHQVMDGFDKSLAQFSREKEEGVDRSERDLYWDAIVPMLGAFVLREINLKSPLTGDKVRGTLFGLPYTTRQMLDLHKNNPQLLIDAIQSGAERSAAMGAKIFGLGAFNSIVTHDGKDLDDTNIAITSGNSYTSALIWQSILKVADYAGLDLSKCVAAVVGAGGNIGSVTASLLAEDIPNLVLIGSKKVQTIDKLREVAYSIYADTIDVLRSTRPQNLKGLAAALGQDLMMPYAALYSKQYIFNEPAITKYIDENFSGDEKEIGHLIESIFFPRCSHDIGEKVFKAIALKHGNDPYLTLTTDLEEWIPKSDIVVSAVNVDKTIMDAAWFKSGAIVNDVSLPTSISDKIYKERPDVIAFEGGVGHLPEYLDLGIPGLVPGATLGCVAETFMCAMMNISENYSFGPITKKQVTKIWQIGNTLGFGLGGVKYQADKKLTRSIALAIIKESKKEKQGE